VLFSKGILGQAACLAAAVLFAVAFASKPALAQPAPNVTGRVIEAFSMGPLAGARVAAGSVSVVTDSDGRFTLTLPRGTARLVVTLGGHLTEQVEVTIGDQPAAVEVLLLSQSQFKEDVVVTAGVKPVPVSPSAIEVSPLAVRSIAGAAENVFRTV